MSNCAISAVQLFLILILGCNSEVSLFGDPTEFRCYVDSRIPQFITWTKDDSEILTSKYNTMHKSYRIENTTYEHAGIYRCHLVYRSGFSNEQSFALQVHDKPELNSNVSFSTENSKLFAKCCVEYAPAFTVPDIRWLIGTATFTPTNEVQETSITEDRNTVCNMITFRSFRQYHKEQLVCLVADPLNVSASMEFNVTHPPSVVLRTKTQNNSTYLNQIWENQTVILECKAESNPPPIVTLERKFVGTLDWHMCLFDFVSTFDNDKILWKFVLPNITRNESGEYRCAASNGVEEDDVSKSGFLDVKYPAAVVMLTESPVNAQLGGNLTIVCLTDSNPSPQVTLHTTVQRYWVALPIQSKRNVTKGFLTRWEFEIRNISHEIAGRYRCQAFNRRDKVATSNVVYVTVDRKDRCLPVYRQTTEMLILSANGSLGQPRILIILLIFMTVLVVFVLLLWRSKSDKDCLARRVLLKIVPFSNKLMRNKEQVYEPVLRLYKTSLQDGAQQTVTSFGTSSQRNTIIYWTPDERLEGAERSVIQNLSRDEILDDSNFERNEDETMYLTVIDAQVHEPEVSNCNLQIGIH